MSIGKQLHGMAEGLLWALIVGLSRLPFGVLYLFSDLCFLVVYYLIPYRKRLVITNLRNSFPEKSEAEIQAIAKRFYHHLTDLMVESLKLFSISDKEAHERIKIVGMEQYTGFFEKKIQWIVATGHYGNWEWLACMPNRLLYEVMSLYKPLHNKILDRITLKSRTRFGAIMVPSHDAVRDVANRVRSGKLSIMCFIADQSPKKSMIQYRTTFLNQDTPVYLGIEKLARKYATGVCFLWLDKVGRGRYEIKVKVLTEDASQLAPYEVTELYMKAMEDVIREKPEYWLWTHRRWKY